MIRQPNETNKHPFKRFRQKLANANPSYFVFISGVFIAASINLFTQLVLTESRSFILWQIVVGSASFFAVGVGTSAISWELGRFRELSGRMRRKIRESGFESIGPEELLKEAGKRENSIFLWFLACKICFIMGIVLLGLAFFQ